MRISDWSSDVCSSDLGDADLARLARPAGLAGSAPDRQANALDRTPHRPAMRKPVVRSAEGQRPRLGRAIIFEDHRPPPVDHPDLHVGRAGRSEEHTSELQSLMRIPYTVLCSKKKK